jgi:hypothetical protein
MEAEGCPVAEDPFGLVAPVPGPEPPEDQVGPLGLGEPRQAVNAPVLPDPVAGTDVVDALVAGLAKGLCLLRCEVTPLAFGKLIELTLAFTRRLGCRHKGTVLRNVFGELSGGGFPPSVNQ